MNGGIKMSEKIEKIEDLRKFSYRCLTDEEWKIIPQESEWTQFAINAENIAFFAENQYEKIARKLNLPRKKVVKFLKGENQTFYKMVKELKYRKMLPEDFRLLKVLLQIPDISEV